MEQVDIFIKKLQKVRLPHVFNPWSEYDKEHDKDSTAPQIRTLQLQEYFKIRKSQAKYILLGEALSYQGGKFTGIAMTSERILLGNHSKVAANLAIGNNTSRTSKISIKNKNNILGMNEPTASIVWSSVLENNIPAMQVVFWNIFPWHPYKQGDFLTNRTPNNKELLLGLEYFKDFMRIFNQAKVVCVGVGAKKTISRLTDNECFYLRHPANGGANEFRDGFVKFIKSQA